MKNFITEINLNKIGKEMTIQQQELQLNNKNEITTSPTTTTTTTATNNNTKLSSNSLPLANIPSTIIEIPSPTTSLAHLTQIDDVYQIYQQQQQQYNQESHYLYHQYNNNDELKKFNADQYKCCPPPLFVILISLIEIGVFIYDLMTTESQIEPAGPIPIDSVLIYRPDRRQQIWRFISYMMLHANWFHLGFNIIVQLIIGLPLEMVHGSLRVACIYLAGVFAGSLGTSVVDSEVYLVGASGGVYALLAAHLANILLNFDEMKYGVSKLASIFIFASCDFGYAIYSRYSTLNEQNTAPSVSYVAHLTGALAGLTIGLLVLKNFNITSKIQQRHLLWWSALGIYTAFTIFAIVFNLINTVTAQILEEEGEVISKHLLHDLGVS